MGELFSPPDWLKRAAFLTGAGCVAVPITLADAPELQCFLERNPEYSRIVNGRDWLPDEARGELESLPPPDWPQGQTRNLALLDAASGAWRGYLNLVEDLLAPGVWHIGLFLIDQAQWGGGLAAQVHQALEALAQAQGARSLRLGVVVGNRRAERFWEGLGYQDVRRRQGIIYGLLRHDLRVLAKPLGGSDMAEHLALVERDRPDSPDKP